MPYIRINNRDNFLISEVPTLHPDSMDYLKYWRRHKKRIWEGFWSVDSPDYDINVDEDVDYKEYETGEEHFRWMPPQLYFYVNFGTIEHQDQGEGASKNAPKIKMRPYLRDLEWEVAYRWAVARGFSGFEDDEDYTCNEGVLTIKDNPEVKLSAECYKEDGSLKEYVNPSDYLKRKFTKSLGRALWNNNAKNEFWLASRGCGKSYWVANIYVHAFITDGQNYYEPTSKKEFKVSLFIGSGLAAKSSETLEKFVLSFEHLPGSWGDYLDFEPSPLSKITSGSLKPNNGQNPFRHEYKIKIAGVEKTKGSGSKLVHGVFTVENPQAAAGGRHLIVGCEEVGLSPLVETIHGSNEATRREGADVFGSSIYIGTGGNVEKIMESYPLFYNPISYDIVPYDDEWEHTGKIGFFTPFHYALNQFKDENGNTDWTAADKFIQAERKKKREANSSAVIDEYMMNYPIKPSEMFISKRGNIFPVDEAKQRLIELERDDLYYRLAKPVKLFFNDKAPYGVDYKIVDRSSVSILDDFPTKKNQSREGCVVIYEFPKYIDEEIPQGLYVVCVDPQKTDGEEGSDSAVQVWKTRKHKELGYDELVAEYYGRPYTGTERVNEIIEMLAMFYGNHPRSIAYENNVGDVYSYFFRRRKVYLLCPEVSTVFKNKDGTSGRNVKYGNSVDNKHDKAEALKYGRNFLLEEYTENDKKKILLQKIPSRRLLKEMMPYNMEKGNFDAVSAFLQYVIERGERSNIVVEQLYEEQKQEDIYDFLDKKINKKDDYRSYRIPQTKNSLFPESF